MNKNAIHRSIQSISMRMDSLNSELMERSGPISSLELDLLKTQCIQLYDLILQLGDEKAQNLIEEIKSGSVIKEVKETEKEEIPVMPKAEVEEKENEPLNEPINLFTEYRSAFVPVSKGESGNQNAEKSDSGVIQMEELSGFQALEEKPKMEFVHQKHSKNEEKSVLEKISSTETSRSIHDKLYSGKEENELHKMFPFTKINRIANAIDISKRFEIQNNLFGGQSDAYQNSIRSLDLAETKEEAFEEFDRIADAHNWNSEDELVKELKSFIYRKF